jgi:hypothetical protein
MIFAQMVHTQWLGKHAFFAHVKAIAPESISSHCIIHHQVLPDKKLPNILLDEVVKTKFYECEECI